MGAAPAFASVGEAIDMARAALGYLAAADAAQLAAETQAECLRGLERTDAAATAARASFLSAFTVGQGYSADADYSARAWLMHRTGITRGAAASHTAWARRAGTHPVVVAALAAGELSESYGRTICQWTDRLPEQYRQESDELLVEAAAAGLGLADLSALFAEMYERARADLPDEDPARAFADRGVRLETTFQGAGVMTGDLTPECAAVVGKVLDALSAPAGAEDDRTQEQRYHDALAEAMRRLVAANLLPERAGQPVKVWAHISLADLLRLDGSSALQEQWTAQVRGPWAAHRAAASETGGDGGAWLDGDAAEAIACDAAMAPIVTGDVNVDALEDLVRLCVELDARRDGAPGRGLGRARASRHRQGRRPSVRPGRAGLVPAAPAARRPAGRAEPAAGHRVRRDHPGRDPQRGDAAGQALPVGRPVRPARRGVPGAPHQAQGQRRPHLGQGLRASVLVPPPGGHPPVGLDPGPEPRRHHHRLEQGQDQGAAQPRASGPGRVASRSTWRPRTGQGTRGKLEQLPLPAAAALTGKRGNRYQRPRSVPRERAAWPPSSSAIRSAVGTSRSRASAARIAATAGAPSPATSRSGPSGRGVQALEPGGRRVQARRAEVPVLVPAAVQDQQPDSGRGILLEQVADQDEVAR